MLNINLNVKGIFNNKEINLNNTHFKKEDWFDKIP